MGATSAMAKAEIAESKKIEDVVHDDRRKSNEENAKQRRKRVNSNKDSPYGSKNRFWNMKKS